MGMSVEKGSWVLWVGGVGSERWSREWRAGAKGEGPWWKHGTYRVLFPSLSPALLNATGGGGHGSGLTFRGTMGSNALSFSSAGGPETLKARRNIYN